MPGTLKEINAIDSLFNSNNIRVLNFKNSNATEYNLRSVCKKNSPFILHLATHGFYYSPADSAFCIDPFHSNSNNCPIYSGLADPMQRCGIVLAGANRMSKNNEEVPGENDGFLTASEISHLDLSNTNLVVLSACETGLGFVGLYQGVFGLQRALHLAGAKNIILSMSKINDMATVPFMKTFYSNLLSDNWDVHSAFYKT